MMKVVIAEKRNEEICSNHEVMRCRHGASCSEVKVGVTRVSVCRLRDKLTRSETERKR